MNWFQRVDSYAYYNGLVNSYLQIGVAWGLVVLSGLLFILVLGIVSAIALAKEGKPVGVLCLLVILVWAISSCFSSMLASPLLFLPPLVATFWTIFAKLRIRRCHHDVAQTAKSASDGPRQVRQPAPLLQWFERSLSQKSIFVSFASSCVVCLLLFASGRVLAWGDSQPISPDKHGVITVSNKCLNSSKMCIIYVDEHAIGRHYGKELRKFLLKSDFGKCVIISKSNQRTAAEATVLQAELAILSGNTINHVEITKGVAKYVLLRPSFLPKDLQCEKIQSIVVPEIDRNHPLPNLNSNEVCLSKIIKIPFNLAFENSWSKYVNF